MMASNQGMFVIKDSLFIQFVGLNMKLTQVDPLGVVEP